MALFSTSAKPQPAAPDNDIAAKIQQRRYQILVHSLIYYELDINIVSDHKWSEWALELVRLQKQYPDIADKVLFADAFKDFDGSTGFDLPYKDEQILNIAYRLLKSVKDNDYSEEAESLKYIRTTQAQYSGFYAKSAVEESKRYNQRKVVSKVEPSKRKKLF